MNPQQNDNDQEMKDREQYCIIAKNCSLGEHAIDMDKFYNETLKYARQELNSKLNEMEFKVFKFDKLEEHISNIGGWANFLQFVKDRNKLNEKLDKAVSALEFYGTKKISRLTLLGPSYKQPKYDGGLLANKVLEEIKGI